MAMRTTLAKTNPELKAKEIMSKVGEMWRGLSKEQKEDYETMALNDRKRYAKEMENYDAPEISGAEGDDGISKNHPKKIKKDPNAPKGAKSPYIFFSMAARTKLSVSNPELKAKEIMSRIGQMWRELPDEEKKQYNSLAKADKERYENEMASYVKPDWLLAAEAKQAASKRSGKGKKGASRKDPNAPKGGKSAYIFFSTTQRDKVKAENPNLKAKEIMSKMGSLWTAMSEEEKGPFIAMAAKDKQRYADEMAVYKKPQWMIDEEKLAERRKQPKRSRSAYMCYSASARADCLAANPGIKHTDVMGKLAEGWKGLSDEAKAPFLLEAENDKVRYAREMKTWEEDNADLVAENEAKKREKEDAKRKAIEKERQAKRILKQKKRREKEKNGSSSVHSIDYGSSSQESKERRLTKAKENCRALATVMGLEQSWLEKSLEGKSLEKQVSKMARRLVRKGAKFEGAHPTKADVQKERIQRARDEVIMAGVDQSNIITGKRKRDGGFKFEPIKKKSKKHKKSKKYKRSKVEEESSEAEFEC
jgi:hypothetical protein